MWLSSKRRSVLSPFRHDSVVRESLNASDGKHVVTPRHPELPETTERIGLERRREGHTLDRWRAILPAELQPQNDCGTFLWWPSSPHVPQMGTTTGLRDADLSGEAARRSPMGGVSREGVPLSAARMSVFEVEVEFTLGGEGDDPSPRMADSAI